MLYIPEGLWRQMLAELGRHHGSVERVAYLDGFRLGAIDAAQDDGAAAIRDTAAVVTTITIPPAELHPGWFRVAADDMRAAGRHLRTLRMTRLAQVHTHGTVYVDHSPTDDTDTYSQRVGAVSIVLPNHGADQQHLRGAGIHVRDRARWRRLSGDDEIVIFVPDLIDLREASCLDSATDKPATLAVSSSQPGRPPRVQWWSRFRRR
jgi:hypothetical protein